MPATRSASLRVAHARACPNSTKTALASAAKGAGCTCRPSYYVAFRDAAGRMVKTARVTDRRVAEQKLRDVQVKIDQGRVDLASHRRDVRTFSQWADEYLGILEHHRQDKGSTVRAYRSTLVYANDAFGQTPLAEIGQADLRKMVKAVRDAGSSDATLHKHLRHLGAVLRAAEDDGLIDRTPLTRKFVRELRLRVPKGDEAYTDAELAMLWAAMVKLKYERVYVTTAKLAVTTGARLGELIGLSWGDVNLSARTIRIRHHYDRVDGLVPPKDRDERTVNLIPAAVAVLEAHVAAEGVQPDDAPVLRAPRSGGRLNGQYVSKLVRQAAEKAGLPEVGEGGRKRKPMHAFRATYTRLCLEHGRDPQWVQRQLGHADVTLTVGVYGRRSDEFDRAEADALAAEAFPV